jgi:mannose-6-phosphate isomerase-like protein (cupin superfamily)
LDNECSCSISFVSASTNREEASVICRYYKEGTRISVAGLNEITVLIDRSETELTEVALNSWRPGLFGPPHLHEQKEQIFFVVSGRGTVRIGDETHEAGPEDFFYVPANVLHHTVNKGSEPFDYLLFNAFLDSGKEGHVSFVEHVEKVKETRRRQAQTQRADEGSVRPVGSSIGRGKQIRAVSSPMHTGSVDGSKKILLDRKETQRCEAQLVFCPSGMEGVLENDDDRETVLFVLCGSGAVTVGRETKQVKQGDVIFVPRKIPKKLGAAQEDVTFLLLHTVVRVSPKAP